MLILGAIGGNSMFWITTIVLFELFVGLNIQKLDTISSPLRPNYDWKPQSVYTIPDPIYNHW